MTLRRDFAEAERFLSRINDRASKTGWDRGYVLALNGMLTANKSRDDKYIFINQIQSNKPDLLNLKKVFEKRAKNLISSEFDRGFFAAWTDFIYYVKNSNILNLKKESKEVLEASQT